jgi:hypothetical protein
MSEKVHIVASPEFGGREGHILIKIKHCTAYAVVEPDGMIDLLTALENLDFSLVE